MSPVVGVLRSRNASCASTSAMHPAADGLLIGGVTGSLGRGEISLPLGAEVWARDEAGMRTGEGVLNQRPCALGSRDERVEFAKLCLREADPWAPPAPGRHSRTALAPRGAVCPSPPGPRSRCH